MTAARKVDFRFRDFASDAEFDAATDEAIDAWGGQCEALLRRTPNATSLWETVTICCLGEEARSFDMQPRSEAIRLIKCMPLSRGLLDAIVGQIEKAGELRHVAVAFVGIIEGRWAMQVQHAALKRDVS